MTKAHTKYVFPLFAGLTAIVWAVTLYRLRYLSPEVDRVKELAEVLQVNPPPMIQWSLHLQTPVGIGLATLIAFGGVGLSFYLLNRKILMGTFITGVCAFILSFGPTDFVNHYQEMEQDLYTYQVDFVCPVCAYDDAFSKHWNEEICPLCEWKDNWFQYRNPHLQGKGLFRNTNKLSLLEAQERWRKRQKSH